MVDGFVGHRDDPVGLPDGVALDPLPAKHRAGHPVGEVTEVGERPERTAPAVLLDCLRPVLVEVGDDREVVSLARGESGVDHREVVRVERLDFLRRHDVR